MRVMPRATGANLSVDADGWNLPIAISHASMPRVDTVGRSEERLYVCQGTPTAGANLMNLAGAAFVPEAERLAWVLVNPGTCVITTGDIRCWDAEMEMRLAELEREICG